MCESLDSGHEWVETLSKLRDAGWMVAVHNDYRLNGQSKTFWLFTHSSGRWIKGEATTDAEALAICWKQYQEPKEFIFKAYNESIIELREKQNIIDSLTKICQNYEANACDYPRHAMAEVQNALNRKKDK